MFSGIAIKMNYLSFCGYILTVIIFLLNTSEVKSELTPPYFNLAEGRKISATSTCGVGTDGPELYCKLVGANTEHDNNQHKYELIQGQVKAWIRINKVNLSINS